MHKMAAPGGQNYWPMIFLRVDQVCRVSLLSMKESHKYCK